LQTLINTSPLPDTTKQKALIKTQDIAEATQQLEAEQQNIVQKTLGHFDGLADSLESARQLGYICKMRNLSKLYPYYL
jgi:hypothetical protein